MESQNLKSGVKWSKCEENALSELVEHFGKDFDRISRFLVSYFFFTCCSLAIP